MAVAVEVAHADAVCQVADEGVHDRWQLHDGSQCAGQGKRDGQVLDNERQERGNKGCEYIVNEMPAHDGQYLPGVEFAGSLDFDGFHRWPGEMD